MTTVDLQEIYSTLESKGESIRILHVDDDLQCLDVTRQILIVHGNFEVDTASSVDEAFQKIESKKYDIVISDYDMPQKNGLQFLTELKEATKTNTIPFILFTNRRRKDIAIKALNLGATGFYEKNGSPEDVYPLLINAIKTAHEKRKREEQEENYKLLCTSMNDGICFHQIIYDEAGKARDYVILDVNQNYEKITGIRRNNAIGKRASEVYGTGEAPFLNIYQRVAESGKTEAFESYFAPMQKYFRISVYSNKKGFFATVFSEITELKQKIINLEEKFEVLEQIAESVGAGLAIIDRNYNVIWANSTLNKVGVKPQKKCYKAFGKNRVCVDCGVKKIFNLKLPLDVHEYKHKSSEGKETWVELRVTPLKDKRGNVTAALELAIPINERKLMEMRLYESENKYRSLFENAQDTIYIHDLSGKILEINNMIEEYGYKKEQIIGKNILEFIPKKFWPKLIGQLSQLSCGKKIRGEIEVKTPMGSRSTEYRSAPIVQNKKIIAVQSIVRDITERKQNEEALFESQQQFRALFSANPEATLFLDINFHVVEANDRFRSLFNFSIEDIKGKDLLEFLVPDGLKEQSRFLRKQIELGSAEIVTKRKKKNGNEVSVLLSGSPVNLGEKKVGYIFVFKDISDIITAQEELDSALAKAKMLNEKLSVVGGLTRHDIRNKLSGVKNNVYLLRKTLKENPEGLKYLESINSSIAQSEEILGFGHLYEKLGSEEVVAVDAGVSFDKALLMLRDKEHVEIVNKCRGLVVLADTMLGQLFYNLLDNSFKHGEKVTRIQFYYKKEKESIMLIYEDNGAGISVINKSKLFSTGFTTGNGSGFGLKLIKRMVETYGWDIFEEGTPGIGVKFVIVIPLTST